MSSVLPLESTGAPESSGASDLTDDAQKTALVLPIVPLPDDEPDNEPGDDPGPVIPSTSIDPEAPYGRKKDGTPAKRRGAKPKAEQAERLNSVTPAPALPQGNFGVRPPQKAMPVLAAVATDYQAMGHTAANLWFNVGEMLFGEDWRPTEPEVRPIGVAFTDYFRAKEVKQFDPGIILLIALGSYSIARANKPTVRSKLAGLTQWLKNKIPGRR